MSSPERSTSANAGAEVASTSTTATTSTSPGPGKFNVTRTSKIAKAGVPLVEQGNGSVPTSPAASPTAHLEPAPPSPPLASATVPHAMESPSGTPPLPPQRPLSHSRGPTPPTQGTPPLAPRAVPVPLITPRYQKKSRTNRAMELTDSFSDHGANVNELRRQHATESLTVTNGPQQYQQEVHFHTYELYRHGSRQIHSRSVGYSSDGDLVMTREDYSEASDVDNGVVRRHTEIANPTVLDPTARRPLTDTELNSKKRLHLRRPRYKKYPGIHAPRNKKVRNRLINDFFVNEQAMRLLNAARQRRDDGLDDDAPVPKPSFQDLPPSVLRAFDLADEAQERELERLGATRSPPNNYVQPPRDPDSAEARFQQLNLRLRGELQHALSSEFLSRQIEDLEVCLSEFIDRGPTEECLVFHFRDGYGRLVCHGVAAYYLLVSDSRTTTDGVTKLTFVSFPKAKRTGIREVRLPLAPLTHVLCGNKSNVPARHPLSANTTPVQAPQPSPGNNKYAHPVHELGDTLDVEPMSPLDLDASAKLSVPVAYEGEMNSSRSEGPGAGGEEKRQVLVNPTVVMTVQGRLPVPTLPVYAPHLQLRQLALAAERPGALLGGSPPQANVSDSSDASCSSD